MAAPTTRTAQGQTRVLAKVPRIRVALPAYYRECERRWRDASFYFVERRRGKAWMYGSITLAASLWAYLILRFTL